MHRRHIIQSLAVAGALPAFLAVRTASAQSPASLGENEKKHAEATKRIGSLSLLTSRLAEGQANDAMVKQFAKFEVAEQETIADILKSMESGGKVEGALKPPSDSEAEAMLDPEGKPALEKLRGMKGADFDKAYVKAQLEGHRKLLAAQEDYLKVGDNREHLSVTKLARGMIREHIDHLEMLQSRLG
ncbi:DUF4142 domain-containing protein [Rhizobium paknamense]|uniref:Outer membrane protein n=1 Tax=Rhizobium paknamense TaxID=1206817 RepID=A0ABU0IL28_9HYPH|nr:DUF4142 domain-containing protein [Rhizobium paknamense]MDQ0458105.1 putative outer membrane protein [Rhizobium paknamense]